MKFQGKKNIPPRTVLIVIPRDDESIAFTAVALTNFTERDKLLGDMPMLMNIETAQKVRDDRRATDWENKRSAYLSLKTLMVAGFEFETVILEKPDTWANWETECATFGFTPAELMYIKTEIFKINGYSFEDYELARESFLIAQSSRAAEGINQSSLPVGQTSI